MITVWNIHGVTEEHKYEQDCRDALLLELLNMKLDEELIIAFHICLGSEEIDVLLVGKNGFVIGELKNITETLRGSKSERWSYVSNSGRARPYSRGGKTPYLQCLIQRKQLKTKLKQYSKDIFTKKKNDKWVPFKDFDVLPRWCMAGLVQVPKLNVKLRGIDDQWWYTSGIKGWLSDALKMTKAKSKIRVNLNHVNDWFATHLRETYTLHDACMELGLIPSAKEEKKVLPQAKNTFSEEQSNSIDADFNRPLRILAGAGAGKTFVLTHRVKKLLDQLRSNEDSMAVITYTNAAADELRNRLNVYSDKRCFIGTVHQFAKTMCEKNLPEDRPIKILDPYESIRKLSQLAKIEFKNSKFIIDSVAENKELSKEQMRQYDLFLEYMSKFNMATFDSLLGMALKESDRGVLQVPKYILVDEYQDSKPNQTALFSSLCSQGSIINVVGDPEQAIFERPDQILGFHEHYPSSNTKKLSNNYRSAPSIVEIGNECRSEEDPLGPQRSVSSIEGLVSCEKFRSHREQDDWVISWVNDLFNAGSKHEEICILFKTNATGQRISKLFECNNIPFSFKIDNYTSLALTHRLIALLRYIDKPELFENLSLLYDLWPGMSDVLGSRLLETFQEIYASTGDEYVSEAVINKLEDKLINDHSLENEWSQFRKILDHAQSIAALPMPELLQKSFAELLLPSIELKDRKHKDLLETLIFGSIMLAKHDDAKTNEMIIDAIRLGEIEIDGMSSGSKGVTLSTIHKSKGLEWQSVSIIDVKDGLLPFYSMSKDKAIEASEQRCLHVAVTRAKQNLVICCPRKVEGRTGDLTYGNMITRFLANSRFHENSF
jgi:DNA helicase-2/ATP-dependent DNA helicase PcrA